MPIDPSIPLDTVGGNPQKLMSLLDLAMKLKANQQAIQSQNQLKQIFSNPENMSQGMPNEAGMAKLYQVDPQFAMGVQKNVLGLQGQKAKLTEDKLQMSSELGEAALNEYDDAIKKGIPEPAARQIFDQEVGAGLKTMGSSGLFTPEEMQRLQSTPLTPDRVRAHVLSYKDRMTLQRQQDTQTRQDFGQPQDVSVRQPDGTTKTVLGQQDKLTGRWVTADENRDPISGVVGAASTGSTPARAGQQFRETQYKQGLLTPEAVQTAAEQALAGDKSALYNLGRGAATSENVAAVRNKMAELARQRGMSGEDLAARTAEFVGFMSEQRALGSRLAAISTAATETDKLIPTAMRLSEEVNRSGFVPLNQIFEAAQAKTGRSDYKALGQVLDSTINSYARAINPTGVPLESDKQTARSRLSNVDSQEQLRDVLTMMQYEVQTIREAPEEVRADLAKQFKAKLDAWRGGPPMTGPPAVRPQNPPPPASGPGSTAVSRTLGGARPAGPPMGFIDTNPNTGEKRKFIGGDYRDQKNWVLQ